MALWDTFMAFLTGGFDYLSVGVYYAIIVLALFLFYKLVTMFLKRVLYSAAKTKKERSNAIVFLHLWRYVYAVLTIIILIFAYTGSLAGLGVSAALLTAALGWALQRPISGIAGWIMVIASKPFRIGDRISIGDVRGDVVNITLTHVYIGEIGGTTSSDERSGRVILVPNSKLFETDIINYTLMDDFVMDEIGARITYESDHEEGKRIWIAAAKDVLRKYGERAEEPDIITHFSDHGVMLKVRYKMVADEREKVKSDISERIYRSVMKSKKVEFAYPHNEIILKKRQRR